MPHRCGDVCYVHAHEKKIMVDVLRMGTLVSLSDDSQPRYVLMRAGKEMLASVLTLAILNIFRS